MLITRLKVAAIALSVTSCEMFPTPKDVVTCPTKPIFVQTEIEDWSTYHVDYVFQVISEGERLGCWSVDDYFGPDPDDG